MLVQDVIVGERRFQYEAEVKRNPLNYDAWFDYIRLEENAGDLDKVREVSLPLIRGGSAANSCHSFLGSFSCQSPHPYACCMLQLMKCFSLLASASILSIDLTFRCTREQLQTYHLPQRSDTGSDIFTCGSTMPCLRSCKPKTYSAPGRCIAPASKSSLIRFSHLPR